jgi:hypothetical protein
MGNWNQAAQGAAGGAAAGAAFGPYGAAIGGVAGGALGYFGGDSSSKPGGYDQRDADLWNQINRAQNRGGVELGQNERSAGGAEFRSGQQDLIRQLQAQARGQGPSLAGMQAYATMDRGMAQQQSLAAGAAPGNEALAARQAMQNSGQLGANTAMTAAQGRVAEQMSAQQQLGGVLQGARGQDINNEQFNAGWTNNRNLSQAQLLMQQRQLNDQYSLGLRGYELQNGMGYMSTPNTLGTQTMSGGANLLATYGVGGLGNNRPAPRQPQQLPPEGFDGGDIYDQNGNPW